MSLLTYEDIDALFAEPVSAEVIPLPERQPVPPAATIPDELRACTTCQHRAKPGTTYHCGGGRYDLPPAYGPNHPLRKLPPDGGANCDKWMQHTGNRLFVFRLQPPPDDPSAPRPPVKIERQRVLPPGYPPLGKWPSEWTDAERAVVRRCFHGPNGIEFMGWDAKKGTHDD